MVLLKKSNPDPTNKIDPRIAHRLNENQFIQSTIIYFQKRNCRFPKISCRHLRFSKETKKWQCSSNKRPMLRLRIPSQYFTKEKHWMEELEGCALIREVHTYGMHTTVGSNAKDGNSLRKLKLLFK